MKDFNEESAGEQESLDALIASASTLILQMGDDSCAPCHAIRFKLDRWLEAHPHATGRYIDIQTHLALCSQMGVMSIPTVVVYMDGKVAAWEAGYFSLDDMLARVERYMEMRG